MEVIDGRGKNSKEKSKKNSKIVYDFFIKHPDKTKTDCSRETGLSYKTVTRHVNDIQKGKK